jgi:protein tyrosine/serine phosphatase
MKDRHWRTRYRVGAYEVWGTSLDSEERRRNAPHAEPADIGLYLDERWHGHTDARAERFVLWPTLESPLERSLLVAGVEEAAAVLEEGGTVEVACFGGHGRTGTVLSCLDLVLGGATARSALERIRHEYCRYAVGSAELERFLFDVEGELVPRTSAPLTTREVR